MELRHLRYFVAVAEELSFTRAAERLHISQSPLSRRVQDLEAEIGAALLDRSGPRLELTPAGHEFLRRTASILEQVDQATEEARTLAQGLAGTVRVGYMAAALYTAAALEMFRRFQRDYPMVRISFELMTHAQQFEALQDGRIDLGVVYEGVTPPGPLARELLAREPLEFMFPKGHALVQQPRLRLADMAAEPFIMPIRSHVPALTERLYAAWSEYGFCPHVVMESDSFPTTVMLVAAGAGIAFAGRQPALRFAGEVDIRSAEDFEFGWGAELSWLPGRESPLLSRLLEYLRQP
ncbi:LysR family transcriptional regulator [Burkholderia multivorans]|uniref:LysR family transcriptional regulator n=1 Tax=Caballeronia novacaledonica TaxID=1544861 RepID=A0ACB5R5E2_9BURK|nr:MULTISPECIES: LysR family transcriptional regulator [Burkholderiaceae]MBU9371538.1 LysR family transcriptional regulator [Burkholderia multivorans]MCA8486699.1 LysR family transcriptional regulator [Burkholderia multivorans]MDR5748874.1 LysR family transcriptional regulator [Caballeronia sp. LZ029]GJH22550.1 LysR family transcriptional regulator [Caballeronia novacaledonica]